MTHQIVRNKRAGRRKAREVAKDMRGIYLDPLGGKDVEHPIFDIEVKYLRRFAGLKILLQAEANTSPGKVPLAVVCLPYMKRGQRIWMLREQDGMDLLGEIVKNEKR